MHVKNKIATVSNPFPSEVIVNYKSMWIWSQSTVEIISDTAQDVQKHSTLIIGCHAH